MPRNLCFVFLGHRTQNGRLGGAGKTFVAKTDGEEGGSESECYRNRGSMDLFRSLYGIFPFSKCLVTMVIVSLLSRVVPLPNGHSWLISGGDPNHLLTGIILQVPGDNWGLS